MAEELFADARQLLSAGDDASGASVGTRQRLKQAQELLLGLGYLSRSAEDAPLRPSSRDPAIHQNRLALLSLASAFKRVFRLGARRAPGAVFFGGEIAPESVGLATSGAEPIAVGGRGATVRQAFEGCIGEAAERLSCLAWGDERAFESRASDLEQALKPRRAGDLAWLLAGIGLDADAGGRAVSWLKARSLDESHEIAVPAALCLRYPEAARERTSPRADSSGCASGPSLVDAKLRALLELVERDAIALWWYGGRPPAALDRGVQEGPEPRRLLSSLRRGIARRTWFLDITTDLELPVVAALSCDDDGSAVTLGFAADLDPVEAARAAALELCQMELAQDIVCLKLEQEGPDALNEQDRRTLDRRKRLHLEAWPQLLPQRERKDLGRSDSLATGAALQNCIDALHRQGLEAYWLDLSRPRIGIPSVRVIVPGLQSEKPDWETERLRRSAAQSNRSIKIKRWADLPPLV